MIELIFSCQLMIVDQSAARVHQVIWLRGKKLVQFA